MIIRIPKTNVVILFVNIISPYLLDSIQDKLYIAFPLFENLKTFEIILLQSSSTHISEVIYSF